MRKRAGSVKLCSMRGIHTMWFTTLLTFRANHITQFGSDEERSRLNSCLKTKRVNDIIECRYGVILGSQPKSYKIHGIDIAYLRVIVLLRRRLVYDWGMYTLLYMAASRAICPPISAHAVRLSDEARANCDQSIGSLFQVSCSASLAAPPVYKLQL
jgi:hypothetical protein